MIPFRFLPTALAIPRIPRAGDACQRGYRGGSRIAVRPLAAVRPAGRRA